MFLCRQRYPFTGFVGITFCFGFCCAEECHTKHSYESESQRETCASNARKCAQMRMLTCMCSKMVHTFCVCVGRLSLTCTAHVSYDAVWLICSVCDSCMVSHKQATLQQKPLNMVPCDVALFELQWNWQRVPHQRIIYKWWLSDQFSFICSASTCACLMWFV